MSRGEGSRPPRRRPCRGGQGRRRAQGPGAAGREAAPRGRRGPPAVAAGGGGRAAGRGQQADEDRERDRAGAGAAAGRAAAGGGVCRRAAGGKRRGEAPGRALPSRPTRRGRVPRGERREDGGGRAGAGSDDPGGPARPRQPGGSALRREGPPAARRPRGSAPEGAPQRERGGPAAGAARCRARGLPRAGLRGAGAGVSRRGAESGDTAAVVLPPRRSPVPLLWTVPTSIGGEVPGGRCGMGRCGMVRGWCGAGGSPAPGGGLRGAAAAPRV